MKRNIKATERQLRKIARTFGQPGQAEMKQPRRDKFEGFVDGQLPYRPARSYKITSHNRRSSTDRERRLTSAQLEQIRTGQRDPDDFCLPRDRRAMLYSLI